jgi:hypothetical protein
MTWKLNTQFSTNHSWLSPTLIIMSSNFYGISLAMTSSVLISSVYLVQKYEFSYQIFNLHVLFDYQLCWQVMVNNAEFVCVRVRLYGYVHECWLFPYRANHGTSRFCNVYRPVMIYLYREECCQFANKDLAPASYILFRFWIILN